MTIRVHHALLTFGLIALTFNLASAQETKTPKAAEPPAKAAAPPPRAVPPEMQAYSEAMRITDPEKKVEAIKKFLADFPQSAPAAFMKTQLQQTLIRAHAGDKQKLKSELDALIAADPEDVRHTTLNNVAWALHLANALPDEAEQYATQSLAALNEQKFIADQKKLAETRKMPAPTDAELKKRLNVMRAHPQDTLGQILLKKGQLAQAEKLLKEAFAANPQISGTAVALAELAQRKGDDNSALDYLTTAVAVGRSAPGTQQKLETLYSKLRNEPNPGPAVESLIDDRYRKLYPTLHVPAYVATTNRSDRTVLAEVFTGSGCPPCVAADLAFDAMLERYTRKDVVVIMYHLHIPAPDPMANPSTEARSKFYGVRGVPSYILDGEMKSGGGSREMTQGFYDRVNPTVEQRLEDPAGAKLALSATLEGNKAKVKVDASDIKGEPTDLKLQIALVEEMLSYSGENGIRLHPVVVRSLGGPEAGGFAIDAQKPQSVEHTFDLDSISSEIKKHLDDFESRPGGRKFSQKKDAINPQNLSVAAFVQDQTTKKILQASYLKLK